MQYSSEYKDIRRKETIKSPPTQKKPGWFDLPNGCIFIGTRKNELGNYYRRIRSRAGGRAAVIATAHKVAEIFYTMVKKQEEYVPSKVGVDEKTLLEKRISRYTRELEKIKTIQLSQGLVTVP